MRATRRGVLSGAMAAAVAGQGRAQAQAQSPAAGAAKPLIYYAGAGARLTMDRDAQGGNPFASALVETLHRSPLTLQDFGERLATGNARHSGGWHQTQLPRKVDRPDLRLDDAGARRVALVLINAEYSAPGVYSLPGARVDAKRTPAALIAAGFATTLTLDADAARAEQALQDFAAASEQADIALIYVGGHGLQHGRTVYWMLGDYPEQDAKWLPGHAITLDRIAEAAKARDANLVLYASCRDDPF
jgi:uncharacterized caspase-like protein